MHHIQLGTLLSKINIILSVRDEKYTLPKHCQIDFNTFDHKQIVYARRAPHSTRSKDQNLVLRADSMFVTQSLYKYK